MAKPAKSGGLGGKYERRKVAELAADPANARKHSDRNLDAIKASLTRFGQQKPIVIDSSGVVRAGNGTLAAAKALGWAEIDCVVSDLAGAEATAYAIADNRTAELAEWDDAVLAATLQSLADEDATLLVDAGYDEKELAKLVAQTSEPLVDDEVPEPPADPITKPGDLWLLGEHRVLCGDSTRAPPDWVAGVGLVIADPPYGIGVSDTGANGQDGAAKRGAYRPIVNDGDTGVAIAAFALWGRAPMAFWWGANYYADALPRTGGWAVWDKEIVGDRFSGAELAWTPRRGRVEVFKHQWHGMIRESERGEKRVHPTQKPVALAQWCMTHGDQSALVCDPFLGSGTTLIAAEQLGRKCYGMEIDPAYCDVIVARWEELTGRKATREPA
jgi:hypothetical protein